MFKQIAGASALMLAMASPVHAVDIAIVAELSGGGAPAGTQYRDGIMLAIEEINASGGILGEKIKVTQHDTQTDPQISKGLVTKAIDDGAYVIMGTVYSSSTVVNMFEAMNAGVPQIVGAEAPNITQKGNPYVFRTSYGAHRGVPSLTGYFRDTLKAKKVAVSWVNNEFGKGGHDVFVDEMQKAGIDVVADIPSEAGAADFAADVSRLKSAGADAVFVYLHEEESARFLKEAKKQGLKTPLVGEVTLTGQKVIDLAGDAANGAVAHVGLTAQANVKSIQDFGKKFSAKYGHETDHNGIKGYIGMWAVKYVTEMNGAFDQKKFADTMHGLCLDVNKHPNMLLTTCWDNDGEMARESFMVEVQNGKQVVTTTVAAAK